MSESIDHLKAADPARGVGAEPDLRAEADLLLLLDEPRVMHGVSTSPTRGDVQRTTPMLVTLAVAVAVIVLTAAVLGFVRPHSDQGSSAPIGAQQHRTASACVAAHVRPFPCGSFHSSSGSGSLAFLGSEHYRLEFRHVNGRTTALLSGPCNGISIPLEPSGSTAIALGSMSTAMGCFGEAGRQDQQITDFFAGQLTFSASDHTVIFTKGASSATFILDAPGAVQFGPAHGRTPLPTTAASPR